MFFVALHNAGLSWLNKRQRSSRFRTRSVVQRRLSWGMTKVIVANIKYANFPLFVTNFLSSIILLRVSSPVPLQFQSRTRWSSSFRLRSTTGRFAWREFMRAHASNYRRHVAAAANLPCKNSSLLIVSGSNKGARYAAVE
jgi:hypothetical protein